MSIAQLNIKGAHAPEKVNKPDFLIKIFQKLTKHRKKFRFFGRYRILTHSEVQFLNIHSKKCENRFFRCRYVRLPPGEN